MWYNRLGPKIVTADMYKAAAVVKLTLIKRYYSWLESAGKA